MSKLPDITVQSIYIQILFRDFLYKFDCFFTVKNSQNPKKINKEDYFCIHLYLIIKKYFQNRLIKNNNIFFIGVQCYYIDLTDYRIKFFKICQLW